MMDNNVEYINPEGLFKNVAFSQVVITKNSGATIYIGGQNSVNEKGEIVGKDDILIQTEQVMKNIQIALKACNADYNNLVKLNIHVVQGQNIFGAFQISQKYLNGIPNPPAITVLLVSALINPNFLIEIDGIAFISNSDES
jgi:enamine deaminase RidA (YjgF/YER057c/UK114 family)